MILKQIIYMGLPLMYMLWTFRRTYRRELDIRSSTRSECTKVSDDHVVNMLKMTQFSSQVSGILVAPSTNRHDDREDYDNSGGQPSLTSSDRSDM